jgi:hypothetical protein
LWCSPCFSTVNDCVDPRTQSDQLTRCSSSSLGVTTPTRHSRPDIYLPARTHRRLTPVHRGPTPSRRRRPGRSTRLRSWSAAPRNWKVPMLRESRPRSYSRVGRPPRHRCLWMSAQSQSIRTRATT